MFGLEHIPEAVLFPALCGTLAVLVAVLSGLCFFWWHRASQQKQKLERLIDSSPDVLLVVSPERTITSCNSAIRAVFGYDREDVIGQKTDLLYFDRRPADGSHDVYHSLEKVGFHVGLATGRRKDGSLLPLELVTGLIKGSRGAVVLVRDISERTRLEEQYLKAKREVEEAHRATQEALQQLEKNFARLKELENLRDQLTSMIVHDLKSPLATLKGYLELVRHFSAESRSADERAYVDEATKLTRRMEEMVLSLLDIGRMEENKMPLNIQFCDLVALARDALEILGQDSPDSIVRLVAPAEPVTVCCDPEVVRRVIVNLVDNALKYTPDNGQIQLKLEAQNKTVRVEVSDNGAGIPPEYHRKIFDRYARVEAKRFSTGLGLTFCDLAVRAHGGTIDVESQVGRWTTFRFILPNGVKPAQEPVNLLSQPG